MRKKVSLCIALFSFGLLTGFLVGSNSRDREMTETSLASPQVEELGGDNEPVPGGRETRWMEEYGKSEVDSEKEDILAKLLADFPRPEIETGTGVISGYVRDEDGEPVQDVLVRAAPYPVAPDDRSGGEETPLGEIPLQARVRHFIRAEFIQQAATQKVATDESGYYELTELFDASYSVMAYKEGYEIRRILENREFSLWPGDTANFVVTAAVTVPVVVFLPDGSQPPSAEIVCKKDGTVVSKEAWDRSRAEILLRPGTYELLAVHRNSEHWHSEVQEVRVEPGADNVELSFELRGHPGLGGRVVFPPGVKPTMATVYALRYTGANPPGLSRLQREGKQDIAYKFDDFSYSISDIRPGTYLLGAGPARDTILATATVVVEEVPVHQDLLIPAPDISNHLVLWIHGPNGETLREVSVQMGSGSRFPPAAGLNSSGVLCQSDGAFLVPLRRLAETSQKDEQQHLTVVSSKYGRKSVVYDPYAGGEMTVRFDDPAILEVALQGYHESGYEDKVRLALRGGGAEKRPGSLAYRLRAAEAPDDEGKRTFESLQPGEYTVVVLMETVSGQGYRSVDEVPVTVRRGRNAIPISLPQLFSLTVVVEGGEPGERLTLYPLGGEIRAQALSAYLGERSRAVFEGLPAGVYRLNVSEQWVNEVTVTVPSDSEIHVSRSI